MATRPTDNNRIKELEREVQRLRLDVLSAMNRDAKPHQIRKGVWYGKLAEALAQGNVADVDIWAWSITDDAWVDTGVTVEARDWFMAVGAADLPINTKVRIEWNHNEWVVMRPGDPGEIIGFELTANLALAGNAAAVRVVGGVATAVVVTVYDPYTAPGMWTAKTGYRGLAVLHPDDSTKADIIWMERLAKNIDFTLAANLSSGSANATVTYYSQQGKNPGSSVTVWDQQSMFPLALDGAKGKAVYNDRQDRYEVVIVQQRVLRGTAVLTATMCGSAATFNTFVGTTFSIFNQAPNPLPTTAANPRAHGGISGDVVALEWNHATSEWQVYDVQKHTITVVDASTIRVKSGGLYLEGETVAIYIERCAAAGYNNLIALTESTYVSNIPTDSDSINQTKRKVRAFGDDATDVTTDVIGIEACP